jgi:hypothetical protein
VVFSFSRKGAEPQSFFFTRRRGDCAADTAVLMFSQRRRARKGFFTRRRGGFAAGAVFFSLAKAQSRKSFWRGVFFLAKTFSAVDTKLGGDVGAFNFLW